VFGSATGGPSPQEFGFGREVVDVVVCRVLVVALMPPGPQPGTRGEGDAYDYWDLGAGALVFSSSALVGLPHGSSQT